jgi:hypothetical protein
VSSPFARRAIDGCRWRGEAFLIAHEIAKRVSEQMTFPGEIRVTVLRETRAIEVAR